MEKPRIGITIGDPAGIGPEIAVKAALSADVRGVAEPVLIGGRDLFRWGVAGQPALEAALARDPAALPLIEAGPADPARLERGRATAEGGAISSEAVRVGVEAVQAGEIAALATAPISKAAWRAAGVSHPGHTEYLAALAGASSFGMLFVGGDLRVLLATIHVPLTEVPGRLTTEGLLEKIRLLARTLPPRFGIESPRIGVAGLNPHAGEGGLFGDEEARIIRPAVERAREEGVDARGPYPADVLFGEIYARDRLSAVLAMYHDQGLIPVKQAAFGTAVNVTIGLPFVRTSPDHGTAFDIAGRGIARESSLVAAVRLAAGLARRGAAADGARK